MIFDELYSCVCCHNGRSEGVGFYELPSFAGAALKGYPLRRCIDCGHTQAHPMPGEAIIADYYRGSFWNDQGAGIGQAKTWKHEVTKTAGLRERYRRARRQLSVVEQHASVHPGAKVLDVGSGYSPFLHLCQMKGYTDLHAIEPSRDVCDFLLGQGVVCYSEMVEEFVQRKDVPAFDIIVLSHTAEHLRDPVSMIRLLALKLKKGGMLYIDVPFQDHLRPFHLGLHFNFFSEASMRRAVERASLRARHMIIETPSVLERTSLTLLYKIYGSLFHKRKNIIKDSPSVDRLHRYTWSPLMRASGLRINIFISSFDLKVVAIRDD